MKDCLYCEYKFEPTKPKQVFCSGKCRTYFGRKKNKIETELMPYASSEVKEQWDKLLAMLVKGGKDDKTADLSPNNSKDASEGQKEKKVAVSKPNEGKSANGWVIREKASPPEGLKGWKLTEWKAEMKKKGYAV